MNRIEIFCRTKWLCGCLYFGIALFFVAGDAQWSQAQVVTWTGAGDGTSYSDPSNWSPNVVPINSGSSSYNVIVPNNANINFNVSGSISGIS